MSIHIADRNVVQDRGVIVIVLSGEITWKLKNVMLGGWLVIQGWIKPSLFDDIAIGEMLVCSFFSSVGDSICATHLVTRLFRLKNVR